MALQDPPSASKCVVITGASGLLGRAVSQTFSAAGWRTVGLAFSRAHLHPNLVKLDITDKVAFENLIQREKPDVIVHCAAEKDPDAAANKPEETKRLNVDATRDLAECARRHGVFLIYISTDYVFDGESPPYKEDAVPHPLNKYGESKLAGEQAVLEVNPDGAAVLRISVLYGAVEKLSESAITVLFEKVQDPSKPAVISNYERRYPTHAKDIAAGILVLAEARLKSDAVKGIYHHSTAECLTKYEMVRQMAAVLGPSWTLNHIKADSEKPTSGAARPFDAQLSCERLQQLGAPPCVSFADGIREVLLPFARSQLTGFFC
ncbi:Methionine adenosyltransferase 2 subunit beta [Hypsibius exemplaris]|uniref:Methionine adenosyltransferase 2 subunit beta n=1 Tax=Hypsibius exemplaris TaxID=2072580 RepID=A0A9X6NCT1_HYPEX|nr:Methionine adenosyltransferase 2 subunit beta [Hypsibius exemplaris]